MSAYARSTLVTIEAATVDQSNDYNEPVRTWATWRQVYASAVVRPGAGEVFDSGQRFAAPILDLVFDYHDVSGLTSAHRIVLGGTVYDIKSVMPDHARSRWTKVEAVQSIAGAA